MSERMAKMKRRFISRRNNAAVVDSLKRGKAVGRDHGNGTADVLYYGTPPAYRAGPDGVFRKILKGVPYVRADRA